MAWGCLKRAQNSGSPSQSHFVARYPWRQLSQAGRTLRPERIMARSNSNETPPLGNPSLAALVTWLIPGAGHVLLGKAAFGFAAFAVVEGLFLAGYALTDGMLFQYLQPELRSSFAGALTPEAGNLGALLWQMNQNPYGTAPFFPAPWPSTMHLGVFFTALSGVANIALCVRAYSDGAHSRERLERGLHPGLAVFAAWLVPGLGHWLQGRKARGAVLFLVVISMLVLGTALAQGANLDRELHFYYWSGQFMCGISAILAELLFSAGRLRAEIAYVDAGLVLGCLAGLVNILAMMDTYTVAEIRLSEPLSPKRATGTTAEELAVPSEVAEVSS